MYSSALHLKSNLGLRARRQHTDISSSITTISTTTTTIFNGKASRRPQYSPFTVTALAKRRFPTNNKKSSFASSPSNPRRTSSLESPPTNEDGENFDTNNTNSNSISTGSSRRSNYRGFRDGSRQKSRKNNGAPFSSSSSSSTTNRGFSSASASEIYQNTATSTSRSNKKSFDIEASLGFREDFDNSKNALRNTTLLSNTATDAATDDDEVNSSILYSELSDSEVAELLGQDTAAPDPLAGVDSRVEEDLSRSLSQFSFPLDPFQINAARHVIAGRSVTVCAPTGAGKTAIAEAAAHYFLREGGRILYTTPLKALSNQKLREMRERFGTDAVGLQTGDASINADASIVIMTTEILRNMLYRTEDDSNGSGAIAAGGGGGGRGRSAEERLAGVRLVVFDECHYLGDPSRGSVWEECIIALPKQVVLLAMSATVRNPHDLSGWISTVHGECDTVVTSFRPVPLEWLYCVSPGDSTAKMIPLLDERGKALNPRLMPPSQRREAALAASANEERQAWGRWDSLSDGADLSQGIGGKRRLGDGRLGTRSMRTMEELISGGGLPAENDPAESWHKLPRWQRIPPAEEIVRELRDRSMLPAIWFIFSRKDCDAAAARLDAVGMLLTTPEERSSILRQVEELRKDQPEAVKETAVSALASGLASHHAGCLPAWKGLIEKLFQQGLVKVVFATETLAAGINMPAKTTLLSSLSRRRDGGIAGLGHNELLQMAGRAGRRGFDTLGHCIIVQSRWEDPQFAYDILRRGPEPLRSRFATNYGMALNLLWSRSMEESRNFLDRSFSKYLGGEGAQRAEREIERLEKKARLIMDEANRRASKSTLLFNSNTSYTSSAISYDGGEEEEEDEEEEREKDEMVSMNDENDAIDLHDSDASSLISYESDSNDRYTMDQTDDAEDLWVQYQKLQGRKREEKRAARLLRSQLAEERGFIAASILAQQELPSIVGLDLSGSNIDDTPYRLAALAVKKFDLDEKDTPFGSAVAGIDGGTYLCLGADNMLYAVGGRNICAVFDEKDQSKHMEKQEEGEKEEEKKGSDGDGEKPPSPLPGTRLPPLQNREELKTAAAVVLDHAETVRRGAWHEVNGGRAFAAEGSGLTAAMVIKQLPPSHLLAPIRPSPEGMDALRAQRARLNGVKAELDVLRSDRRFARASKRYYRAANKANVLLDRAAALKEELEDRIDGGWKEFGNIVGVLEAAGAFEPLETSESAVLTSADTDGEEVVSKRREFTALGKVARELRGSNELWLAIALTHPALQILTPPQLAAVVSSLVAAEAFNRANVTVAYPPSMPVIAAVESLESHRAELAALQIKFGLDVPLGVDLRLAGVVEAWASGVGWAEVTADCGLDDGDVARLLMRTVDTLRQAAFCEHLPLRDVARKAASSMNRKPISDLVA